MRVGPDHGAITKYGMILASHEDERALLDESTDEILPSKLLIGGVEFFLVFRSMASFVFEEFLTEIREAVVDYDVGVLSIGLDLVLVELGH